MKKIQLSIIIIFVFTKIVFSQSDFRKGFIITNENDTINGFINYREGIKKHKVCEFKLSEDRKVTSYFPKDINGYKFLNDKYFVTKEFTFENNAKKKVFFEILVQGKVTLYKYLGDFFVEKYGEEYIKLTNEKTLVNKGSAIFYKYSNRYIGILSYLLSDCKQLKEEINTLRFLEMELTDLIESYNNCIEGPSVSFKENKPWLKTSFGFLAGMNSSKISFKSNSPRQEYLTSDFDHSNDIMAGLFIDFLSPRINERISLHADLFYLNTNYISYSEIHYTSTIERNDVKIDLKQLKIPLGLRYTFPDKKFTPFINMGVSYTYHIESSSWWIREVQRHNIIETFEEEALDVGSSQFGFWGGIGVKKDIVKKWAGFIELRYEQTSGISTSVSTSYVNDAVSNIQFLIGISY
jgi:hypothetical protein